MPEELVAAIEKINPAAASAAAAEDDAVLKEDLEYIIKCMTEENEKLKKPSESAQPRLSFWRMLFQCLRR
jgi:hypothetical protein